MSYARTNAPRPLRTTINHPSGPQVVPPSKLDGVPDGNYGDARAQNVQQERVLEHRGAYSVKAPDPTKRNKIQRVAEAESKLYDQYKQRRREPKYTVTQNAVVGTANNFHDHDRLRSQPVYSQPRRLTPSSNNLASGTSNLTGTSSYQYRSNPVPSTSGSGAIPKKRVVSLKTQTARMEDPEIERRKAVQRQKAEAKNVRDGERHHRLQQDMRAKNNDFLDRLEGKR